MTRVLILGVTGMLGNAVFKEFSADTRFDVWGTLRTPAGCRYFPHAKPDRLLTGIDVLNHDALVGVMEAIRPDIVINCVGLIKQLADASDPLIALPVNSLLPHRLARLCDVARARLIHVSTDCVFAGRKGSPYLETDTSDAEDLYGKSKYLGELHGFPNAITLRTSIIGHELASAHGLVDWFLSQERQVNGYARAIFSGLPTVELARIMRDVVVPALALSGLFHVSAQPISKLDLLRLVAEVYEKNITIVSDENFVIDRSLDSTRFTSTTGYVAPAWPALIAEMRRTR
jgi:dTDP-4-dehydrorhamnose reductase